VPCTDFFSSGENTNYNYYAMSNMMSKWPLCTSERDHMMYDICDDR
jgi:hypothetical protein